MPYRDHKKPVFGLAFCGPYGTSQPPGPLSGGGFEPACGPQAWTVGLGTSQTHKSAYTYLNNIGLVPIIHFRVDVDFRDVNARFIEGFTKFLQPLSNRKDSTGTRTLSPNSMVKQLKIQGV